MKKPNIDTRFPPCWRPRCFWRPALVARAADLPAVRYQAQATNTQVTIQGTSTFHDWEMKGTTIGGFVDVSRRRQFRHQPTRASRPQGRPAAGQRHGDESRSQHPERGGTSARSHGRSDAGGHEGNQLSRHRIYKVTELKLQQPRAAGQPFAFDAKGSLAIAGVTNTVVLSRDHRAAWTRQNQDQRHGQVEDDRLQS